MTQNGWRKPTPGLLQAERFAEVGERLTIPKTRAIVAVKKVAAAIGLKAQDLLLLDTFGAVTQAQDWEQGRRPIVWASNHFLMEQTGFSVATLRRHVRRLCEVGVIAMKDSPNGKRWGRRDAEGVIVEAYGFDLAPLAARAEEFEALHQQLRAERAECASLRRAITVTRRVIRAQIERALEMGQNGPWQRLRETYAVLLTGIPGRSARAGALTGFLDRLKVLLASVEDALGLVDSPQNNSERTAEKPKTETQLSKNVIPSGLENETHIRTTKEPYSVRSSPFEKRNAVGAVLKGQGARPIENVHKADLDINWSGTEKGGSTRRKSDIDIPILMAACPHFAEMARASQGYLRSWTDVHRAAAALRPHIGISREAWDAANKVLGPTSAAASIALILDKTTEQEITSPSRYLRGLVRKAQSRELHLERSLYGRMAAVA